MKKSADKQKAGDVAMRLVGRGFEVKAIGSRNGDGIALAALGIAANKLDVIAFGQMPGVQECSLGNKFYGDHIFDFKDAHDFFSWGY